MTGQRPPRNKSHHRKTQDCEPHGRAVLLGSLTLLLSTRAPFPNKLSCFVSTCVSSDNSFPSFRQDSSFGPWKGSPFLQHYDTSHLSFVIFLGICNQLSYMNFNIISSSSKKNPVEISTGIALNLHII